MTLNLALFRTRIGSAVALSLILSACGSDYSSIDDVVKATCPGVAIAQPAKALFAESESECSDEGPYIAWFANEEDKASYWRLVQAGTAMFGLQVEILDEGTTYIIWKDS